MTKYIYLSVLQGNYGYHGWEDLDSCETKIRTARQDLKMQLKEYRVNDSAWQSSHRIIKRRVLRSNLNQ